MSKSITRQELASRIQSGNPPVLLEALTEAPVVIDGRRAFEKARLRRYEGIGLWSVAVTNPAFDGEGVRS